MMLERLRNGRKTERMGYMSTGYKVKRDILGFPQIEQGLVHGLPVTWNPDDDKFYVHKIGIEDGTNVLGKFHQWPNAVYFAKRKMKAVPA